MARPLAAAPPSAKTAAGTQLDHLSWSGIQSYSTCPKRFRLRYLEIVPEERKAAALLFGGAFHKAVETLYQARLEGRPCPPVPALLAEFERAWTEEAGRAREIVYSKGEGPLSLQATAERMLAAFRTHLEQEAAAASSRQILALEHASRFPLIPDAPPMEARLDVLELEGTDLLVTEIKSSKCKWNEQKVSESLAQLVLYAHVLVPVLRTVGATRIRPRFLVVSKAKKPVVQVLEPKAGKADVERLRERIAATWKGVQAGVFPAREGWWCAACPFRVRCLGR